MDEACTQEEKRKIAPDLKMQEWKMDQSKNLSAAVHNSIIAFIRKVSMDSGGFLSKYAVLTKKRGINHKLIDRFLKII